MQIVEINVQFHLFQEVTNQFTVVIVLETTNHKILDVIDIQEMIEVQDHLVDENQTEMIEDLDHQKVTNSQKDKKASSLMVLINSMQLSKKNYLKF